MASKVIRLVAVTALVAATGNNVCWADPTPLPVATAESVGLDPDRLEAIDRVVHRGLARGRMPGCVVMVGYDGKIVYHKAFGNLQVEPQKRAMNTTTVFDMASLTKPVATATSVMKLLEQNKIQLHAPVVKYIPEFGQNGKENITIYHLLTHQGGLIPDNSLKDYRDGAAKSFERIYALKPIAKPQERFIYTDVGFLVLADVVKRVTGKDVHEYSRQNIFEPLGMEETGYLPGDELKKRAVVTQEREGRWMQGEVHDPRAYLLGGVAGHAGLFSTAKDLSVYAQMLINGGEYQGVRILKPQTVHLMTDAYDVPGGQRGLGWDKQTGYSSNRGDLFTANAFGHGGFTGTAMWIDPKLKMFVIFLSNRVHPDGKGSVNALAGRIGTLAASAIPAAVAASPASAPKKQATPVLTGIDVLVRRKFDVLKGKAVGLITNQTGVARNGRSTIEILHRAAEVDLRTLFSPEHGIEGKLDVPIIGDAKESKTGLKVFSLYGSSRVPSAESLDNLDVLVFDIQDIGARFYTFISTMANAMKAAAEHDVQFVVLDRPNPINGVDVQGPVLDDGRQSFVGVHTIPVRHGMTVGELAEMFNAEMKVGADLVVVPVQGWSRSDYLDETGLWWVNPSPNMRNLTQAILYPGIGLLETTNISVGRGTDTPFEVLGAPWIDGRRLAGSLNEQNLPGVRFVPIRFTPASSKHQGELCQGINILITDRSRFHPLETGLEVARQLRRLYRNEWNTKSLNRLLNDEVTLEGILRGDPVSQIKSRYLMELEEFRERRSQFLRY